ncbi:MAG: bacillithiol biosynthesis deacetylase BshB1 [Acidobacteria bacterium]|nr:MAG: bacillithiol biosynthesis deacetylase BshB1 [Acidobacteriota bacterium]REJ99315.1 MAG: bacillithiol biosynthesis deacetylase BshB1 [Acidobacteriota bacterium]REK15965.1 MAG: bacillithiol biosynthesis deacetylase BshB1 [Acidobacteriota bacterium]REK43646.1 MAG: bacillithiol biosynthesis deacetylase BshB1 [Acidobacteriota bacterium]
MQDTQVDVLAIFAHPDDLELTVGGTMLKMKSLGYKTGAVDVTRGEMGTRGTVKGRAEEAEAAAEILGLSVRENLELKDGHVFCDDPSRRVMVRALRRLRPKVIFTHQIGDPHPDHDHISQLVRESARLSSMGNYDRESGLERLKVPMVAHNIFSRNVRPSFVVDISEFHEKKMDAIKAHASQFHDPNSIEPETRLTDARFLEELSNRSKYFGSLIGVESGEPYFVREALNVQDPVELLTQPMNLYS